MILCTYLVYFKTEIHKLPTPFCEYLANGANVCLFRGKPSFICDGTSWYPLLGFSEGLPCNTLNRPLSLWISRLLLLWFLGGLNLHLNHLIQSCMEISYRLFGTLPIGLLLSNLDLRQLETSPMTSYDQFWNMSNFDDSRAVRVICQKKMPSENQFFLDEGVTRLRRGIGVLGGQVPRLYGGTIFGGVWHTWGVWRGI